MPPITRQEFDLFLEDLTVREVTIPSTGEIVEMPLTSRENTSMTAIHPVSRERVLDLLPRPDLVPAELPEGRSIATVTAIEYANRNMDPYNEIIVGIPVALGVGAAAPTVESLLEPKLGGAVLFLRHLIVDTRLSEILGNEILGYNKFISDIEFTETDTSRSVRVSEGGQDLFTLTVQVPAEVDHHDYDSDHNTVATLKNGKIYLLTYPVAVEVPQPQPTQARLALGDHPLGRILADLEFSEEPLLIRFSRDWRLYSDERNLRTVDVVG